MRILSVLCAAVLFVPLLALAQSGSPNLNRQGSSIIRSETDLVELPVTVTDHRGEFVSGLTEDDFHIDENGQPQSIFQFAHRDVPVTVGLLIDSSGSMAPNRVEVAQAAKDFLIASNPRDQVFVVSFNEKASLGLSPSMPFTNDVAQLQAAVISGPSAGMTALYDAVTLGLKHLQLGSNDKKALLIISDGGDNASHEGFSEVLTSAEHDNAIIYAIGIVSGEESDVNPRLLRKVAKATGGQAYFPQSANELPGICQQIARDLREQYELAYIPSNRAHDGTYRTIRVTVHAPGHRGLIVRTRAGYFASSDSEKRPA